MEQLGISKLDLKRQNRMQILKIIKQKGPTSRIDIAGTLELTRAAVTIITNEMIEQGIIVEIGELKQVEEKAHRGRKKILLDINHNYKFAVGIIIEETRVEIGLSTLNGAVLDKRQMEVNDLTLFEDILTFLKSSFDEILLNNCLETSVILGAGVGIFPSMYSRVKVDVVNKAADYKNIKETLQNLLGIEVVIDNYVKGAAMANIDFKKNKDPNQYNIAFLKKGTTYDFVVTNLNEPIKAYDNRTDFVDKMIINPCSENSDSVRKGSIKAEISPMALINKIKFYYSDNLTPYLYKSTEGDISKVTRGMIFYAVNNGDDCLKPIYTQHIELLAVLINNLSFSTNPQKFVLHDFEFTDKEYSYFRTILSKIAGDEISNIVDLSLVESKNRFLAGSAIVIRELFFSRGGFQLPEK